jgi:MFS transporter, PPP family, 3-phenylpropionic acid transporter
MSSPPREPTGSSLAVYYLIQYSTIGISLPFMGQYLKSLGFSGTEVGLLLGLGPVLSLVAPPLWGQLADRSGRPGLVLLGATAGSALSFSLLLWAHGYAAVFAVMLLYSCFSTAIATLIDAMALGHVARAGGSYAGLRLWGSVGCATAAMCFGRFVSEIDARVVAAQLVLLGLSAAWTTGALRGARSGHSQGPRPTLESAYALTQDPTLRLFLVAVALHWLACGAYHSALSIHVTAMHLPPSVVGDTATVGVVAEIIVMITWPRWGHRFKPHRLLAFSFLISGLRWILMGLTASGPLLIALAVIHGFTFGAFYLSSIAWLVQRVPESLRATGQALYAAAVYGVGGLCGYLATGVGIDLGGSHAVFLAAGALEVLPALLILQLPRFTAVQRLEA